MHHADLLGLLDGLGRPDAGIDIVGHLAGGEQILGQHGKLGTGSALQEEDLVVFRDPHHVPEPHNRIFDQGVKFS